MIKKLILAGGLLLASFSPNPTISNVSGAFSSAICQPCGVVHTVHQYKEVQAERLSPENFIIGLMLKTGLSGLVLISKNVELSENKNQSKEITKKALVLKTLILGSTVCLLGLGASRIDWDSKWILYTSPMLSTSLILHNTKNRKELLVGVGLSSVLVLLTQLNELGMIGGLILLSIGKVRKERPSKRENKELNPGLIEYVTCVISSLFIGIPSNLVYKELGGKGMENLIEEGSRMGSLLMFLILGASRGGTEDMLSKIVSGFDPLTGVMLIGVVLFLQWVTIAAHDFIYEVLKELENNWSDWILKVSVGILCAYLVGVNVVLIPGLVLMGLTMNKYLGRAVSGVPLLGSI